MSNEDYITGFNEGYEQFAERVVIRMVTGFMQKLRALSQGSPKTYALLCDVTTATFAAQGLLEEIDLGTPDVTDELMALLEEAKHGN